MNKRGYVSFVLSDNAKDHILSIFKPTHENIVCHHITYEYGVDNSNLPELPEYIVIYGYAVNDVIETLVVSVGEETHRPDGKAYHITLSHSPEGRPVMSNDLLAEGWEQVEKVVIRQPDFFVKFNPF